MYCNVMLDDQTLQESGLDPDPHCAMKCEKAEVDLRNG